MSGLDWLLLVVAGGPLVAAHVAVLAMDITNAMGGIRHPWTNASAGKRVRYRQQRSRVCTTGQHGR